MRNLSFILAALLLVDGVFGVEKVNVTVSVMEGDSVTLNPHTVILQDDSADWKFDKIIAKKNALGLFSTTEVAVEKFKGCLNLDKQTGSLTITNITTDHAGLYKLQISSSTAETFKIFNVTVTDNVTSLSVLEGDNVTLHTDVIKIHRDDQILLKSGDQDVLIADLNGPGDTRWGNGDLTITNIRRNQSGKYELKINTSSVILHRKLRINISGKMTKVSVKEGESITLHTGLFEIKGYDLILWKFTEQLIAEINKGTNHFLTHDTSDEIFEGRLQMDRQSGDLTIRNSRTTDAGDYHLHINSSTHTVQRTISVTVSESRWSFLEIWGIVFSVLLVVIGIIFILWKCCWNKICCKRQRLRYSSTPNPMADPRAD